MGIFLSEKYRSTEPKELFSVAKYEKLKMNPQKADTVIAICMQRDPKNRVPEWEELAAVAMAVQNLWLSAHAYGIGGYWSTPELISAFGEFHPLAEGEKCIGFFYLGYYTPSESTPPRRPLAEKVKWVG
jgi:nitroreductase